MSACPRCSASISARRSVEHKECGLAGPGARLSSEESGVFPNPLVRRTGTVWFSPDPVLSSASCACPGTSAQRLERHRPKATAWWKGARSPHSTSRGREKKPCLLEGGVRGPQQIGRLRDFGSDVVEGGGPVKATRNANCARADFGSRQRRRTGAPRKSRQTTCRSTPRMTQSGMAPTAETRSSTPARFSGERRRRGPSGGRAATTLRLPPA